MLRPLKGSGYKTEETNIRKFNCNREYNTYSVNKNYVTSSWLCFKTLQKKIHSLKFPVNMTHPLTVVGVMKLCELWILFILVIRRQWDSGERSTFLRNQNIQIWFQLSHFQAVSLVKTPSGIPHKIIPSAVKSCVTLFATKPHK